ERIGLKRGPVEEVEAGGATGQRVEGSAEEDVRARVDRGLAEGLERPTERTLRALRGDEIESAVAAPGEDRRSERRDGRPARRDRAGAHRDERNMAAGGGRRVARETGDHDAAAEILLIHR